MFYIAANFLRGDKLVAAAVIYRDDTPEPSFTYTLQNGRARSAYLHRKGVRVAPALYGPLVAHIKRSALSWAVVTAHPGCPPEAALSLAVVRAAERWGCRLPALPRLDQACVLLPGRSVLTALPDSLQQTTKSSDWRVFAARSLCQYHATLE